MKRNGIRKTAWNPWAIPAIAFGMTLVIFTVIFVCKGYAPFGLNSVACNDANIDYIDVFAFLKDVLAGKNSGIYSFSKGFGGNMIAVLTTGYASPLNLLVVFFEKQDLHSFFDIAVALKVALAAFTMGIFLVRRFREKINAAFVLLLSVAYAFCQYNFAQASNIFFLEGMYMMPLFALGTYHIAQGKKPYLLLLCVAYNVLFSWYSAAWNCFMTIIWAVFELAWTNQEKKLSGRDVLSRLSKCAFAGIAGIMISGVLFLPTIMALGKGNEGTLNFELFENNFGMRGNVLTAFTNYSIGSISTQTMVSMFCGSLVLSAVCAFFFSEKYSMKQKLIAGGLLLFAILMFYWQPLFLVFSVFKAAESFFYRYSYLGIFVLIFIASLFLQGEEKEKNAAWIFPLFSIIYFAVLMLYYRDTPAKDLGWVYISAVFMLAICLLAGCRYSGMVKHPGRLKRISAYLLALTIAEMCCNVSLMLDFYHLGDIDRNYIFYADEGHRQIRKIQEADQSSYRITQTRTRGTTPWNLTATYDEPMQFNYWSLTAYTSCPDDNQREFLARTGYPENGEDMYIVNTSVLPIDSLLGVKYILADYLIPGLTKMDFPSHNGKETYLNPYAFPMAFSMKIPSSGQDETEAGMNPFEYQNWLLRKATGIEADVFVPVNFEITIQERERIDYRLDLSEGIHAVYGNFPWARETGEMIYADDQQVTAYAQWTSPNVVFLPGVSGNSIVSVRSSQEVSVTEAQLYEIDFAVLGSMAEEAAAKQANITRWENGDIEFRINGTEGTGVLTSVSYDPDWQILRNGEKAVPELLGDCLMMIPLADGENTITMRYQASGIRSGIILTIVGLLAVAIYWGIDTQYIQKFRKGRKKG